MVMRLRDIINLLLHMVIITSVYITSIQVNENFIFVLNYNYFIALSFIVVFN